MALNVILLEDDPEDESLTLQIIDELQLKINISFVSHSNELFTHLNQQSPIDLIMVDMNAKPDNGLEVLRRLKSDKNFNAIPIVILTDIADQNQVRLCYAAGASSIVRKPDTYAGTKEKIEMFFKYWMMVAELTH